MLKLYMWTPTLYFDRLLHSTWQERSWKSLVKLKSRHFKLLQLLRFAWNDWNISQAIKTNSRTNFKGILWSCGRNEPFLLEGINKFGSVPHWDLDVPPYYFEIAFPFFYDPSPQLPIGRKGHLSPNWILSTSFHPFSSTHHARMQNASKFILYAFCSYTPHACGVFINSQIHTGEHGRGS